MKILRYLFRPLSSGCAAVSCALLFTACIEVDYDFGGHAPEPQVTINALLTPHIAWATNEALQRLMDITTNNLRTWLDGAGENIVNG